MDKLGRIWKPGAAVLLLLLCLLLPGCSQPAAAPQWALPTIIYDRNGAEVYRLHAGEDRQPIGLSQVPQQVRLAFLAIEDPRFYQHGALDWRGVFRAVVNDGLRALHLRNAPLQGGSSITQQLARDAWLGQEQTWQRKFREASLAFGLEQKYSKDQILELYLNQIYFGNGSYGIERAAQLYFHKPAARLKLHEGALLAGLINGPSLYDPYQHPAAATERRNLVLDAMVKAGNITAADATQASAQKLGVLPMTGPDKGNAFVDQVLTVLTDPAQAAAYGITPVPASLLARVGLKVYTTMDPKLQALAQSTVTERMAAADAEYGLKSDQVKPEAALATLQPKTGQVLALVGGRSRTGMRQFNRATAAVRQPGSAFKPFVAYLPGLEAGLSPATVLDDAAVSLTADGKSVWPENYDYHYHGLVSLRYAVEQSLNPVAVRAMNAAGGPATGLASARRFGFSSLSDADAGAAIALGGLTHGVTPLEMASAYGTFANLGTRMAPVLITRIEDANGQVLFAAKPQAQPVTDAKDAYLMVDILKGVITRGTAYGFTNGFGGIPAAGKTGTTDDNKDAWFVGFTPDLVTAVWTGYDAPQPLKWTGAYVPVQIWNSMMTRAVPANSPDWSAPADVVSVPVCRHTGMLPNDLCPQGQVVNELFRRDLVPTSPGNLLVRTLATQAPQGGWLIWQPSCGTLPQQRVFIHRPEPWLRHPTAPNDPRYVPADAGEELPTQVCTPQPVAPPPGLDWLWQMLRAHH